jgi:hypothetical protein
MWRANINILLTIDVDATVDTNIIMIILCINTEDFEEKESFGLIEFII